MSTIIITGASRGLGKELALLFAEKGWDLILAARDHSKLTVLKNQIIREFDVKCTIIAGDIVNKETINEIAKSVPNNKVDVLINNAGRYLKKPFTDTDICDIEDVLNINLIAPIKLTHVILPIMQKNKTGVIVNINSIASESASVDELAYCVSKFGLRGFSESLQFEATKSSVRVIDISLGAMNTNMIDGRKDPQKCIQPLDVAKFIYSSIHENSSMRMNKVFLNRMVY